MDTAATFFKALSDQTRLRIVHLLSYQKLCVCQLMEAMSISQAKVSRHLAVLRQAGLVTSHKQAQWVWYQLTDQTLLNCKEFQSFLAGQIGADEDFQRMQKLDPALLCGDFPNNNEKEC